MTKFISHKTITLISDGSVMVSKEIKYKHLVAYKKVAPGSLKRVQHLINCPNNDGEQPLVSLYSDGTFGVFRSFWKKEKETS